jgi:thymidylate synthase (FAD)
MIEAKVKLISKTQGVDGLSAEDLVAFTARVSNPANQMNMETAPKLLAYLIKNKHWSPYEMVSVTLEIKTSRAIAAQILRHRSFSFQEFSQRYAEAQNVVLYPARRQDQKNRQNSVDDMADQDKAWFESAQEMNWNNALDLYKEALSKGIAKEQARFLLPLSTETTIYMSGTLRSWIHYIELRASNGTQKEHMDIAKEAKVIFIKEFPNTSKALGWTE